MGCGDQADDVVIVTLFVENGTAAIAGLKVGTGDWNHIVQQAVIRGGSIGVLRTDVVLVAAAAIRESEHLKTGTCGNGLGELRAGLDVAVDIDTLVGIVAAVGQIDGITIANINGDVILAHHIEVGVVHHPFVTNIVLRLDSSIDSGVLACASLCNLFLQSATQNVNQEQDINSSNLGSQQIQDKIH